MRDNRRSITRSDLTLLRSNLLVVVALIASLSAGSASGDTSPIPLDSRIYRDLDWILIDQPQLPRFQVTSRPYFSADLVRLVDSTHPGNFATETSMRRLRSNFHRGYWHATESSKDIELKLRSSPYLISGYTNNDAPLYRIGLKQELGLTYLGSLSILVRGRLENKGDIDSFYHGRKWEDKITGYFDYGIASIRVHGLTVQAGRSFRVWGAGDTDRLLLSANAPAFDQLSYQFNYKRLHFETFAAQLDKQILQSDSVINRYLFGHRVSVIARENLQIGISETALVGRYGSGPDWYYFNPLLPYYWEQFNSWADDNIYMGADFVWWPFRHTRVFGELMIDDFQIDFVSELDQVGLDLGVTRLGFWSFDRLRADLQYTQIRNYVYGQRLTHNRFTNYGVIIGSSLGPDVDRLRYAASYVATDELTVSLGGVFSRRGEGRISDPQDINLPRSMKFPSGIIEKTWTNYLRLELFAGTSLSMVTEAGYTDVKNKDNTEAKSHSKFFNLNLQYDLEGWFLP